MIYKVPSLLKAEAVVNLVMTDEFLQSCDHYIFIESYQNGREQGFTIVPVYNIGISVAENRNSDNIVVYVGKYAMQSISEDAWENKRSFDYNDFYGAAKYIRETIKEIIGKEIIGDDKK